MCYKTNCLTVQCKRNISRFIFTLKLQEPFLGLKLVLWVSQVHSQFTEWGSVLTKCRLWGQCYLVVGRCSKTLSDCIKPPTFTLCTLALTDDSARCVLFTGNSVSCQTNGLISWKIWWRTWQIQPMARKTLSQPASSRHKPTNTFLKGQHLFVKVLTYI